MAKEHGHILVVDDNRLNRLKLSRGLEQQGHIVASAENGQQALDMIRTHSFDLVLLDIVMPEMDGIELARKASELDPTLKIMFITGFAAVTLNTDAAPNDARVLSKPFHLKELVSEIDGLLGD